jgi:hypothetical protein
MTRLAQKLSGIEEERPSNKKRFGLFG